MQTVEPYGKNPIEVLYSLGLMGMIFILVCIHMSKDGRDIEDKTGNYSNISGAFTYDLEGAQPVDVRQLGTYMDPEKGVLSIYYQLPEIRENVSLIYRS